MRYRLWQVATLAIRRLPLRLAYAVAWLIGTVGYYLWPRGRRATRSNFRRVLPDAPDSELRRVARQSLVNYCKYVADFVRFPGLSREAMRRGAVGSENFSQLDGCLARGRGVVAVCMHFGNWDLGAGAVAARGYPVTAVAASFGDSRLDDMVVEARRNLGMQVVKMDRAAPSLVRSLKKNQIIALLIDRPVPGDGVPVTFFGEQVEVPSGPARLALRSGAKVVPTAFARLSAFSPTVEVLADFSLEQAATGDEALDVQHLTQAIMCSHERFIRQHPEQWYMFRELWPARDGACS